MGKFNSFQPHTFYHYTENTKNTQEITNTSSWTELDINKKKEIFSLLCDKLNSEKYRECIRTEYITMVISKWEAKYCLWIKDEELKISCYISIYSSLAKKNDNFENTCNNISNKEEQKICNKSFLLFSDKTKLDDKKCDLLDSKEEQDSCKRSFIFDKINVKDGLDKWNCLELNIIDKWNCENIIKYGTKYNDVLSAIVLLDIKKCDKYTNNDELKNICFDKYYLIKSINDKDKKYCDNIVNDIEKYNCVNYNL